MIQNCKKCVSVSELDLNGHLLLNISSMRFVMTKPPETFTKARRTDNAPSA